MLNVENLQKKYPLFELKNVSFSLDSGYIMGFIGSNGAGKTTTLKSLLNLVHKDGGIVTILGRDYTEHEIELKQDIGFMLGGADYYPKHRIKEITDVVRRFYKNWDEPLYEDYLQRFELAESKKIDELSGGMRVKYSLALALSHHAKLLILDEPTSGLDPVARDDLLELFQELIEDGKKSILFSTHITSDLEKCADYITYIKNGQIVESLSKDDLIAEYRIVKGTAEQLDAISEKMISYKTNAFGSAGLIRTSDLIEDGTLSADAPSLEEIMIYHEKRKEQL